MTALRAFGRQEKFGGPEHATHTRLFSRTTLAGNSMIRRYVHGEVFCVWDRTLGWRNPRKCRPCVIVSADGAGGVTVVPRTTRPRDPAGAIASAAAPPAFDIPGFFVPVEYPIFESDLLDHRGSCPAPQLGVVIGAVR